METPPHDEHETPRLTLSVYRQLAFDVALMAAGVILFLVLVAEMTLPAGLLTDGYLSPPLIGVTAAIVLWPLRRHQTVRALMLAGGALVLLWLLMRLSAVLVPFVLTYLLAYLFNPVVTTLRTRYRVPRWASSMLVTALVVGLVVLFMLLLVPSIVDQLETLGTRILASLGDLRTWLITSPLFDSVAETGLVDKEELTSQITAVIQEQTDVLTSSIPNYVRSVVRSLSSLLAVLTMLSITPVILFYTLKDYPFIKRRLVELFPTVGGRRDYLVKAGSVVGNYLRGQLTISAIAAFNVSVALIILDVPFALLIGLLGGLLNMIPNLGIIITNVIGVLLAMVFGDPWLVDAVLVLLVLLGQSLLEQAVLTPKILSYEVGLHPVLVVLSLFVFGYLLGIFGLLIAVPATALIMASYKAYRTEMTLDLSDYATPEKEVMPPPERVGSTPEQGSAATAETSPQASPPNDARTSDEA